ncbi:hypothetical protein GCM10018952_60970 [Streptosporangium vulgare]
MPAEEVDHALPRPAADGGERATGSFGHPLSGPGSGGANAVRRVAGEEHDVARTELDAPIGELERAHAVEQEVKGRITITPGGNVHDGRAGQKAALVQGRLRSRQADKVTD